MLGYIKSNLYYKGYDKFIFKNASQESIEIRINEFDSEISNDVKNNHDLQVTVILEAINSLEAIIKAQSIANEVINHIAFCSKGRIDKCIFFKSISFDEEDNVNEFCQLDFEILDNIAKKEINISSFLKFLEKLNNNQYDKERIERAIMFYQKGLSSKEILEQFNNYWIALECITPILNLLYPQIKETRKCKNCGHEEEIKSTAALKYFFDKILKSKEIYSKCRNIRVSLVHGLKNILCIEKEIIEIIDKLEYCTYHTIVSILNLEQKRDYDISDENEGLTFELHLDIVNFKIIKDEKIVFPNVSITIDIERKDNVYILKPLIKASFLTAGVGIGALGWDYYGTCGLDIEKIQLKITN